MLSEPSLTILMEAHNGLSARIVEEAGFDAIWASGLAISASLGLRDSNEASWTQTVEVAEFMAEATSLPILFDGDTGYGNFNSVRRLTAKLEQRGIAGVCLEDKLFPKTNSLLEHGRHELADACEFAGKIAAAKASQRSPDFVVVARVEALIAGWGLDEALRRADKYEAAGADAILIHSAKSTATEVLAFRRAWRSKTPLVIVPTSYYRTPTTTFREAGFAAVIWANHLVRAGIAAMQRTAAMIRAEQGVAGVEKTIAPLGEVFRLQRQAELDDATDRYLAWETERPRAIVLRPNEDISARPPLEELAASFRAAGVADVTVPDGRATSELDALARGLEERDGVVLVARAHGLATRHLLQRIGDMREDLVVAVDTDVGVRAPPALVARCTQEPSRRTFLEPAELVAIGGNAHGAFAGTWTGLLKATSRGARLLRETIALLRDDANFPALTLGDLLTAVVDAGSGVRVIFTTGEWIGALEARELGAFRPTHGWSQRPPAPEA